MHANRFSENANHARERRRQVLLWSGNAIPEEENMGVFSSYYAVKIEVNVIKEINCTVRAIQNASQPTTRAVRTSHKNKKQKQQAVSEYSQ